MARSNIRVEGRDYVIRESKSKGSPILEISCGGENVYHLNSQTLEPVIGQNIPTNLLRAVQRESALARGID